MEPGLLVWDDNERCVFYTDRLRQVLSMRAADLHIGMTRKDFLNGSLIRGEISEESLLAINRQFQSRETFQFDRQLRSGQVISTRARPLGENGFVVTFTDVSMERTKSTELDETIRIADEARAALATTLEQEKKRQYEAGILNEFGDWLQSCKTLDELFAIVLRYLEETLPGSQGELYIYSNSRDVLEGTLSWGRAKLQAHIHADSCWSLRRGRGYRYKRGEIGFECAHVSAITHLPIEEYSCIPIVAHGDTVGLLHVRYGGCGSVENKLTDPTAFAFKCGELISLAIANVRLRDELHEQSTRDMLTGLRNRRYCIDTMSALRSASERSGAPFAVISLDVDKFKDFNDNFGHDAGDAVLQNVASTMRDTLDAAHVPCRFGGEEFLVILPECTAQMGLEIADTLRRAIMQSQITYAGKPLPNVTISSGVAAYPETSNLVEGLLKEADLALYQAKDNGRNRVECAPPRGERNSET
nr:diguanylate cyclase [Octadecabacter dasysiphoniae]